MPNFNLVCIGWVLGMGVMEQDPMVNSAIGFDLGISKDLGIITHRRESTWVDNIGKWKRGLANGWSYQEFDAWARWIPPVPGDTGMAQDTQSIIVQTSTSRKSLWGVIVASQKRTKRPIRFVSCARAVQAGPVSTVQIMAQNKDKQSIRGCPRRRPMVCLHVCRGANDYIREDRSKEKGVSWTSNFEL